MRSSSALASAACVCALTGLFLTPEMAAAQPGPADTGAVASPAQHDAPASDVDEALPDVDAAAAAYDRGSAAFLRKEYAVAGRWFESAFRFAPNETTLLQAIRAFVQAGDTPKASSLAFHCQTLYPERVPDEVRTLLADASLKNTHVVVVCAAPCSLTLDGRAVLGRQFFVQHGARAPLVIRFETGVIEREISVDMEREQRIVAVAPEPKVDATPAVAAPQAPRIVVGDGYGLHPAVFWTSLGLTVVAAVGFAISLVLTLDERDTYETMLMNGNFVAARQHLEQGQTFELMTNIAMVSGLVFAGLTLVLAPLTRWSSEPMRSGWRMSPGGAAYRF